MSGISTHVLNTASGKPAVGIGVTLDFLEGADWVGCASQRTDTDGRCGQLVPLEDVNTGIYRISFSSGDYFEAQGQSTLYPEVSVQFRVEASQSKYHIPLLLSPFGYSTYRGS